MSMLQLRNIPERMKHALRRRAADEGLSMSEYVLRLIGDDLERPTAEEILRRLEALPDANGISGACLLEEARREAEPGG